MSNLQLRNNIVTYLMTEYSFLDISRDDCINAVTNVLDDNPPLDKSVLIKCERQLIKRFSSAIEQKKQKEMVYSFIKHEYLNKKHDNIDKLKNIIIFFNNINGFKDSELYIDVLKNNVYFNIVVSAVTSDSSIPMEELMGNTSINNLIQDISIYNVDNEEIDDSELDYEGTEDIEFNYDKDVLLVDTDAFSTLMKDLTKKHGSGFLTEQETRELIEKAQSGDYEARNILIEKNWRLILSIAKRYNGKGLPLIDLFQEGCVGMAKGIDYFDLSRSCKLSTYCTWWVRQAIVRANNDNGHSIRLPVHIQAKMNKFIKLRAEFINNIGREPTDEEIAKKMHVALSTIKQLRSVPNVTASLNTAISDEEDSDELGDFVADTSALSPEDMAINSRQRLEIDYYLSLLKKRTADVIRLRFGFYDSTIFKLEEIAKIIGITRERVRQIESKGLKELKKYMSLKKLPSTLNEYDVRHINDSTYLSICNYYNSFINTEYLDRVIATLSDIDIFVMNEVFANSDCSEGSKNIFLDSINVKILEKLSKLPNSKLAQVDANKVVLNNLSLYFTQYPSNVIEELIGQLNKNDIEVILYKCLPHKRRLKVDIKDVDIYFYNSIISKMYEKLDNICPEVKNNKRTHTKVSEYEYYDKYPKEVIDKVVSQLDEGERAIFDARFHCDGIITFEARREYAYTLGSKMMAALEAVSNGEDLKDKRQRKTRRSKKKVSVEIDAPLDKEKETKEGGIMPRERNTDRYDYLKEYGTNSEIDQAFGILDDDEREIANKYFSNGEINSVDRDTFRVKILPKLKRRIKIVREANEKGIPIEEALKSRTKGRSGKRRSSNVYEYFEKYGTKEQIDAAISMLDEKDREILNTFFVNDSATSEIKDVFYTSIIQKMKGRIKKAKENETKSDFVEENIGDEELKITVTSNNTIHLEGELITEPDKSEDNLFMQLFKYPHFQERAKQLPFDGMMAISLKLWYNAGTDQIASVLGMDISRVNEITSNALNDFKADLMSFLNGNGTFNAEPLQLKEGKSPYVKSLSSQNSENKGN